MYNKGHKIYNEKGEYIASFSVSVYPGMIASLSDFSDWQIPVPEPDDVPYYFQELLQGYYYNSLGARNYIWDKEQQ